MWLSADNIFLNILHSQSLWLHLYHWVHSLAKKHASDIACACWEGDGRGRGEGQERGMGGCKNVRHFCML